MNHIISSPTVFMLKLPKGEWLNLASVRRIRFDEDGPITDTIVVEWLDGSSSIYRKAQAAAVLEALQESEFIDKSGVV